MHFSNGNSWDPKVVYNCKECGVGNLCDVCHRHCQPRGECDECVPEKPKPVPGVDKDGPQRR